MTKERPILFSGAMVRAILDVRKTQTRRVMSERHRYQFIEDCGDLALCPYGQSGDRLWVRETWAQPVALDPGPTVYRADYPACVPAGFENIPPVAAITWKPSIHMPRALSRIRLEIVGTRVERLNDCSERDAEAEGVFPMFPDEVRGASHVHAYSRLWDDINGAGAWAANPWVWVVEFRRIQR